MSKRFFAFGCSFTNYRWWSWADIIGEQFSYYQNWAQAGAGNHYIFNSIMECDQRQRLDSQDTVIVCWTNTQRDDRYSDGRGWITLGHIPDTPIYTKEFLVEYISDRGNIIRDMAYIKAIKEFLEHRRIQWYFLSMCPFVWTSSYDPTPLKNVQDILDAYQDVSRVIRPSFMDILGTRYWETNQDQRFRYKEGQVDYHPLPSEHLAYLDAVLPEITINEQTRKQALSNDISPRPRFHGGSRIARW